MDGEASFPRGHHRRSGDASGDDLRVVVDNKEERHGGGDGKNKRKGGTSDSTRGVVDSKHPSSIKQDFLFGTKKDESTSRHKRLKNDSKSVEKDTSAMSTAGGSKHSLLPLGGGGVVITQHKIHKTGNSGDSKKAGVSVSPVIESLGFSKLATGTKVLACVRQVNEEYALLSLPNMLTAYMLPPLSNSSASSAAPIPLGRQLHVGQTLAVVIEKVVTESLRGGGEQRRIQVTAAPQIVNSKELLSSTGATARQQGNAALSSVSVANRLARDQIPLRGQIVSVEDHGCVVDVGYGKRGFLKFDQIQSKNYILLDDDEDEADEDDEQINDDDDEDAKEQDQAVILQRGRLYDFMVLAPTVANSSVAVSSNDKKKKKTMEDDKAVVLSLMLPAGNTRAKMTVSNTSSLMPSGQTSKKNLDQEISPLTLTSITPGWLVQAKVEAVATNGLCVSFFGNVFRGAIEMNHLGATVIPSSKDPILANSEWKKMFHTHQHFPARIVAVDVATKLVRLSISPSVLTMSNVPKSLHGFPSVGTIVEDCTVVRVDPGIGALLALPDKYNRDTDSSYTFLPKSVKKSCELFQNTTFEKACQVRRVYVHISKAIDEDGDSISTATTFNREFAASTKHSVRILSTTHWMEGMASGGCSPSILEAHVLTHDDLVPGKVYKQVPVCAQTLAGNIVVQLGGQERKHKNQKASSAAQNKSSVRGLIPATQLFDTSVTDASGSSASAYRQRIIQTKFAVNAKVDVRVLWVDPLRKKCLLTAKKTIVQADDSLVVTSYADIKIGQVAVGYVSKVDDQGLSVTLFNKVYGRVTSRSLASDLGVENPEENYKVGDVVTCRVVKLTKKTRSNRGLSVDDCDEMDINNNENGVLTESEQGWKPPRVHWELTLSLKTQGGGDNDDEKHDSIIDVQNPCAVHVRSGAILPAKSMKIVELVSGRIKESGGFIPGYAVVRIKSKYVMTDESVSPGKMPQTMECKLPFEQLVDNYDPSVVLTMESMDELAHGLLQVGKKINQKAVVLVDPRKTNVDYASGIGRMPTVSLRKELVEHAERQSMSTRDDNMLVVPSPNTPLQVGDKLIGFVAQVDPRYGSFVRFLDGLTGMVSKKNRGLTLHLFDTVITRVIAIDSNVFPHRILLEAVDVGKDASKSRPLANTAVSFKVGDKLDAATISSLSFYEATLDVAGVDSTETDTTFAIHVSSKDAPHFKIRPKKRSQSASTSLSGSGTHVITKHHPFNGLKEGQKVSGLTVIRVLKTRRRVQVYVTDRKYSSDEDVTQLSNIDKVGTKVTAVVLSVSKKNLGLTLQLSPTVVGFLPALELCKNVDILNDLESHIPVGAVLKCQVINKNDWYNARSKCPLGSHYSETIKRMQKNDSSKGVFPYVSALLCDDVKKQCKKIPPPSEGDLVIGRIDKSLPPSFAPSVMLDLRGGYVGRCCITELEEPDEWMNLPLGKMSLPAKKEHESNLDLGSKGGNSTIDEMYGNGRFVECRVVALSQDQTIAEVSLRASRINGDIDEDPTPAVGHVQQGYVIQTNKNGCFVRLSRTCEGRATLKNLCDGFLPHPDISFPMGRLVAGKVTNIRPVTKKGNHIKDSINMQVDLDMRESTLLDEQQNRLTFENIQVGEKYSGSVQRIEDYGVFVQLQNSSVTGLVHLSECSDGFVKNLSSMFDPGDLVKVLVLKKDEGTKQLGFSMKASHFEDDEDSDDSSVDSNIIDAFDETSDVEMKLTQADANSNNDSDDVASDDEDFVTKLASKAGLDSQSDENDSSERDDEDEDDGNSSDTSDDEHQNRLDTADRNSATALDTNVGFIWGAQGGSSGKSKQKDSKSEGDSSSDSSDESYSDSDEEEGSDGEGTGDKKKSKSSRKRQAERRRLEQETYHREMSLADGSADANPETADDFERLLAGSPNDSELWIRYMSFHLSLADIVAARVVANKALERIEFRQEREKLNVWTALLTLEHKYGNESTFQAALDRACSQNNPKHVYLRACEILEKDLQQSSFEASSVQIADKLFLTMCHKHKSKKKTWLAYMQYLLRQSRHQEAQNTMKRALKSLPSYKHTEVMSRFAQMEYELGSPSRARTLFDGLIEKFPKRLDLFFVYVDKECKYGTVENARKLLEAKVHERKLKDNKMKSLFKKWYRIEEEHGTEDSREHVKSSARSYVEGGST